MAARFGRAYNQRVNEFKTCPWCGESILAVAKKCKHCGEVIPKDELRIVLAREIAFGSQVRATPINVHARCAQAELDAEDCLTEVEDFAAQVRQNSEVAASVVDEALAAVGDLQG